MIIESPGFARTVVPRMNFSLLFGPYCLDTRVRTVVRREHGLKGEEPAKLERRFGWYYMVKLVHNPSIYLFKVVETELHGRMGALCFQIVQNESRSSFPGTLPRFLKIREFVIPKSLTCRDHST